MFELTKQQQEVIVLFKEWLELPKKNRPPFVLLGHAGTGKTTVAKELMLLARDAVAIAPTHQAANVLASKIGKDVETTAQSIGLSPNLDISNYDPGNPLFVRKKAGSLADYTYGIQDEASMLSDEVMEIQCNIAHMIYLGDPSQLPPVKQKLAKLLSKPNYILTEIVRTSDTTLIDFCNMLRGEDWMIRLKEFSDKIKDLEDCPIQIVKKKDYVNKGEKVLAYTNKCVGKWNKRLCVSEYPNTQEIYKFYDKVGEFNNSQEFKFDFVNEQDKWYSCRVQGAPLKVWKKEFYKEYGAKYYNLVNYANAHYRPGRTRQSNEYYQSWTKFYNWRAENLVQQDFKYKNKEIKKQFDYGYCFTLHRAQGSSISVVAIDVTDIFGPQTQALLYVGASRAQNKIILIKS